MPLPAWAATLGLTNTNSTQLNASYNPSGGPPVQYNADGTIALPGSGGGGGGYRTSDYLAQVAQTIGVNSLSLRQFAALMRSPTGGAALVAAGVDPGVLSALIVASMSTRRRRRGITYRQIQNARRVAGTVRSMSKALFGVGGHHHHRAAAPIKARKR